MQLPDFCECQHPLVQVLHGQEDGQLLQQFQGEPEQGRAFVALFCRYALVVYALVSHKAPMGVQVDYLFATTWRYLYQQMRDFSPPEGMTSLQTWLVDCTGDWLTRAEIPAPESIHYRLPAAPPPLWCYLQEALQKLATPLRLLMLLKTIGHWSDAEIAQELSLTPAQVAALFPIGQRELLTHLPSDIWSIYLEGQTPDE